MMLYDSISSQCHAVCLKKATSHFSYYTAVIHLHMCHHKIIQLNYTHGYTAFWIRSDSDLIFPGRMHVHCAANSTTNNANLVYQVAYMSEPAIERQGIQSHNVRSYEHLSVALTTQPQKHTLPVLYIK